MIRSLIFIFIIVSQALTADVTEIIKEIQEKYEEIEYLSADFVQTEQYKLTGSKNETRGKLFIKDGVQYRLETEDQSIATDGETVWTFSKFNNQVLIDRVKEGDGSLLPRDLLFKYPKDYFASLLEEVEIEGANYFVVKLDPKEGVYGFIKSMKIWVDEDEYIIHKIEYTDFNDNVSMFEVQKVDIEKKLPDGLFKFRIKEGMEVVDLRM
jgi:outer membrane lipoprotein carrier protein